VDDPVGFAEGVLAYDMELAPGARQSIVVAVPLHTASVEPVSGLGRAEAAAWADAGVAEATAHWRARLARVPPWHQWPEVSTRDPRAPRFLGDLPHGWIASSFVRSVRRMIAYERADDGALVLGAGVPAAWVREVPGIRVRRLPTHAGPLDYTMYAEGDDRVRVALGGALRCPRAGIVVESPLGQLLRRVAVDGREQLATDPRRVILRSMAAQLILDYRP
jgi:hypothetical protein